MFIDFLIANIFNLKLIAAMLSGVILQYLFAIRTGIRFAVVIILATFFLIESAILPILDHLHLDKESPLRIIAIGFSALLSVEIIAMLIKIVPSAMKDRIITVIGGDK